jgi:hypothetical protein
VLKEFDHVLQVDECVYVDPKATSYQQIQRLMTVERVTVGAEQVLVDKSILASTNQKVS